MQLYGVLARACYFLQLCRTLFIKPNWLQTGSRPGKHRTIHIPQCHTSDSLLRKAHLGFFGLVSGFGLGLIVVRASGLRCLASEGCRLLAPKTSCITTTSPFGFRVPHNSKTPNPTPMSTGHPRSARPKHWNRPWALARGPSTN